MDDKLVSALFIFYISAITFAYGQLCSVNPPPYDPNRSYDSFSGGIQALVPAYEFPCSGVVSSVSARVQGTNGRIDFQVWRPLPNHTFHLLYGISFPGIFTSREGTILTVNMTIIPIPVRRGDVIGFYIENVQEDNQLELMYETGSRAQGTTVYYVEGVGEPLCDFSLCDDSVLTMPDAASFISIVLGSAEGNAEQLSQVAPECSTSSFSNCPVQSTPTQPLPAVTMSMSVSTTPMQLLSTSQQHPLPSPTQRATTTEDVNLVNSPEQPANRLIKLKVSIETAIIIAVGLFLFIILIVLVIVLVGCVCHKRGSLQLSVKSEVESVGGLTVGDSEEQEQQRVVAVNGITVHENTEAGSECSHYYSTADIDATDGSTASKHPDERLCRSVCVLQNGHGPVPPPRRHSIATCKNNARSINHYSVLEPPFEVPPPQDLRKCEEPEKRDKKMHYYSVPEYPVISPNYDRLGETPAGTAASGVKPRYDKLKERPASVPVQNGVKHRYDQLSMPYSENETGSTPGSPKEEQSPTDQVENNSSRQSMVIHSYVPTEEQRRLLQLHNDGHYEIGEEIQMVLGYDKLKFFEVSDIYWAPAATTSGLYTQLSENKYREINRSQIRILKQIGCGHFGTVSKGTWELLEGSQEVAVKTVKTNTDIERIKLLQEAAIMGQFAHVNVVKLHGVVTVGDPVLMILEYMPRGDLRTFLTRFHPRHSKKPLPEGLPRLFIKFSKDTASGMRYLSKKCFVHRDLAARNVLLTNNLTCKIGDFGMARDIEGESDYYKSHGGIVPVKWTAPEALNYNRYTSASDVWSYGMVLFEIWSLGQKPFHDLSNPIVIALVSSKHCQPPPPGCPRPLYQLMVECWNPNHTKRPTFDAIHDYLESPEESILQWRPEDIIPGKQAHIVGAPLLEANNLYFDLQRTYQKAMLRERTP